MWRFGVLLMLTYLILIFAKNEMIPALLHILFPVSDFRAMLYEIIILMVGVGTIFLSYFLGSFSRSYYRMERPPFFLLLFLLLGLFFLFHLYFPHSFLSTFLREWADLVGESYRLLTFSYLYSDWVGFTLLLITLWFGYEGRRMEEKRSLWGRIPFPYV